MTDSYRASGTLVGTDAAPAGPEAEGKPKRNRVVQRFGFWLGMVNLVVFVPLLNLPVAILMDGHMAFHLVYIPCLVLGLWLIWQLKRLSPNRALRIMAWILLAAQPILLLGHAGELFAVIHHGGFEASDELFNDPDHQAPATLTLLAITLTLLALVAINLFAAIRGVFRRALRLELLRLGLRT
jgi:hypothetical protein